MAKKIRRINIYGLPGAGKSTLMHYITYRLKAEGYNVECVMEKAKEFVFAKRSPDSEDNLCWAVRQIRKESSFLKGGVDLVVTDDPIYLSYLYGHYYDSPYSAEILELSKIFDEKYHPLSIILPTLRFPYKKTGRYQEESEILKMDNYFMPYLANDLPLPDLFPSKQDSDHGIYLNMLSTIKKLESIVH